MSDNQYYTENDDGSITHHRQTDPFQPSDNIDKVAGILGMFYDTVGEIILGDCLEVMRGMADNSVDCIITSPPYNMRTRIRNGQYTEREKSEHFSKKYKHFHDALPIEDYYQFHKQAISEMLRLSPLVFINIQLVTGSKEAWFRLIGDYATNIKDVVVWDKGHGQPAMHSAVLNRCFELILVLESPPTAGRAFTKSYFKRGELADIWRLGRGGDGDNSDHSAVFPKKLVGKILTNWTKEGDIILDPFNGTGTTTRACKDHNRNYIGIELSPDYVKIAQDRLKQEVLL